MTDGTSRPPTEARLPAAAEPATASRRPAGRRSGFRGLLLLILAAAGVALALNGFWNPPTAEDTDALSALGTLVLVLLFVGSAFLGRRLRVAEIVRGVVAWAIVLLVLVTGYAYRGEIATVGGRILAAFAPGVPIAGRLAGEADEASVVIVRGRGGQFAVRARVDGAPLTMLVDTGATYVTLTLADAAGAGMDIRSLAFTVPIRTANGLIRAATIIIDKLVVGTIVREGVPALVAPPDTLTESLLGMSFLETLKAYSISGDRLVLTD